MRKTVLITACLYTVVSQAQDKSSKFSLQAGVITNTTAGYSISNNDTSLQNKFSVAPYLRIMHENWLGIMYSAHAIPGVHDQLFMHMASVFYEQYDKPINLNFRYTHFFFNNNTAVPYSPISNELYGFIADRKLWIAPALATSVGFGNDENKQLQSSVNIAAGAMHSFTFSNKTISDGEISPAIFLNAGNNEFYSFLETTRYNTQNAGSNGFLKNHGRGKGRGNSNSGNSGGTVTDVSTTSTNKFTLNNIELNLYSSFTIHHVEITPDASIFAPLHSSDGFASYWQLKLGYNF